MRALLPTVLFVFACSNDFDALYAPPGSADGGSRPAGSHAPAPKLLPELPALPDLDRVPGCKRCAEDTCSMQRSDCLEDDDCIDELGCMGKCDNPACMQGCTARHGFSPWYIDYANCVFGQCRTECNVGNNWQCTREYDWPAAAGRTDRFDVEFRFTTPPTLFLGVQFDTGVAGQTVRACQGDRECGPGLDSDVVSASGVVTLTLTASSLPPRDFRGYLEVEESSTLVYTGPLARAQAYYAGFLTIYPSTDPLRARLGVAVVDCLAAPVAGARVSLPGLPEIAAFAFNSRQAFSPGPTTASGLAALVDLPDSAANDPLRVRADRNHGEVVAERAVWVRPGWNTFVTLFPASRSD